MSENLDLVRSIYADWERGDFSHVEWADSEIEFMIVDGPTPGTWTGLTGLREGWREWLGIWDEYRVEVDEYRELDSEHVLVLLRQMGCGKKSGLPVTNSGTNLLNIRDGRVTRLALCTDRARPLADLGLQE